MSEIHGQSQMGTPSVEGVTKCETGALTRYTSSSHITCNFDSKVWPEVCGVDVVLFKPWNVKIAFIATFFNYSSYESLKIEY